MSISQTFMGISLQSLGSMVQKFIDLSKLRGLGQALVYSAS